MSDLSKHKVVKLRPLPLPARLALAAFPESPGTPFALRRALFPEERKDEVSGFRARQPGNPQHPEEPAKPLTRNGDWASSDVRRSSASAAHA